MAALAVACALVPANAFVLPRVLPRLFPTHRREKGRLEAIHYPMALIVCILSAADSADPKWYLLPAAAWFALAVLDGFLGIAHAGFRSPPLPWNARKSWPGLLIGSLAASVPAVLLWHAFVAQEYLWLPPLFCVGLGVVESLWLRIDDNFTVPFAATALLACIPSPLSPHVAFTASPWLTFGLPVGFAVLATASRKLSVEGAWMGAFGSMLLMLAHPGLFVFTALFFLLGIAATAFRFQAKQSHGIAESQAGRRGAAEVFGALGVAAWLTPLVRLHPENSAWSRAALLVCIAPFVAKTMDTVSSEIGKAWRGATFTLWPLQRVEPGTEGGLSWAGTAAGWCAAGAIALPILIFHFGAWREWALLFAIAAIANLVESLYGSWLGKHGWDDGPHANLLLTLTSAVLAYLVFF